MFTALLPSADTDANIQPPPATAWQWSMVYVADRAVAVDGVYLVCHLFFSWMQYFQATESYVRCHVSLTTHQQENF